MYGEDTLRLDRYCGVRCNKSRVELFALADQGINVDNRGSTAHLNILNLVNVDIHFLFCPGPIVDEFLNVEACNSSYFGPEWSG